VPADGREPGEAGGAAWRPRTHRPSRFAAGSGRRDTFGRAGAPVIVGIGSDMADIRRIERTLERFGERFIRRCFTETERAKAARRVGRREAWAGTFAKRWAAKEACSKALGTGLRMGIAWREMGVVNLPTGQPTLRLEGAAAERLERLAPPGAVPRIHLTMTDDYPWALAFVVIEALPADAPDSGVPSAT